MSCLRMDEAFSISKLSAKATSSVEGLSFSSCSDMRVRPLEGSAVESKPTSTTGETSRMASSDMENSCTEDGPGQVGPAQLISRR